MRFRPPQLDPYGVPQYQPARRTQSPKTFTQPRKVHYESEKAQLFAMGFTQRKPKQPKTHFGASGTEVLRFDDLSAGQVDAKPDQR